MRVIEVHATDEITCIRWKSGVIINFLQAKAFMQPTQIIRG
jgi:hypothetical protein